MIVLIFHDHYSVIERCPTVYHYTYVYNASFCGQYVYVTKWTADEGMNKRIELSGNLVKIKKDIFTRIFNFSTLIAAHSEMQYFKWFLFKNSEENVQNQGFFKKYFNKHLILLKPQPV